MTTIMQRKMLRCIVIITVTLTNVINAREEWIDPHDMNIRMNSLRGDERENSKSCYCDTIHRDRSSSYLRKVVTLITDMTYFDRRSDIYKGVIDINLKTEDYDFLRKFISTKFYDEYDFAMLSKVLDKSVEKSFYSSYLFTFSELIYLAVFNEMGVLFIGIPILFYVLWRIQPHNYKLTTLFKLFFPLVYIADFVLRYKSKMEEAEIDQYIELENYKGCDPNNLGWFDWIYDAFTGYCKTNQRRFLMSQRPSFHIFTPLSVISDQFDVVVNILKHLGSGFGSFLWSFIEQAPWYIKPFVGIFGCVLVVIMMVMVFSYALGLSPKFSLFYHLIHLEVLHKEHAITGNRPQQDSVSGANLTKLIKLGKKDNPVVILAEPGSQKKYPTFKTKPKIRPKKQVKSISSNDQ